jgi:hypothetical protein
LYGEAAGFTFKVSLMRKQTLTNIYKRIQTFLRMIIGKLTLVQLTASVEHIPMAFRCGFVLLLALVMVLMKSDDKEKKKVKNTQ